MNVLLIGGSGFVGKALTRELKNQELNIFYLSRTKNNSELFSNCTWIQGDIFTSKFDDSNLENIDIAIHLIGTIKGNYKLLNTESVKKSIELCEKFNIKKLVFLSAGGGFSNYLESKLEAERIIKNSDLDYLVVKPGLMYGKDRLSSYINIIPIKLFSALGITFFKNVYPLSVERVARKIVDTIIHSPCETILTLEQLKITGGFYD